MTYEEAIETVNSLLVFGGHLGLERISELEKRLGSPDKRLKFVHIAGTNGKGSTAALLANTLTSAGYKTGLFISPYVLEFRERFQIDGNMMPKDKLAEIVERLYPIVLEMREEDKVITEFEFVFAIALEWYAEQNCDIVVLETGLGGRFDATNMIDTPLVSVITSISFDHMQILGDTYSKIAFEKCGIIKPNGITVVYGEQYDGVTDVIGNAARDKDNELYIADINSVKKIRSSLDGSEFIFKCDMCEEMSLTVPLIGDHQLKNSATALYTLMILRRCGFDIPYEAIKRGFATVKFPARLQLMRKNPIVLLDGAHNRGGAEALAKAVKDNLGGIKKLAIVGMLADKEVERALSELIPLFDEVIAVEPNSPRAMKADDLAKIASKYCTSVTAITDCKQAYDLALSHTDENGAIVIFGSLYLAESMIGICSQ